VRTPVSLRDQMGAHCAFQRSRSGLSAGDYLHSIVEDTVEARFSHFPLRYRAGNLPELGCLYISTLLRIFVTGGYQIICLRTSSSAPSSKAACL